MEMDVKSPKTQIEDALGAGLRKVALTREDFPRLAVLSVLAGAYIAFGGILSLIVGYGFPEITAANPALQKLLSGAMFPIGLILVVTLGAELFTGNNALLVPGFIHRKCTLSDVLLNWTYVYFGNFVGALLFTYVMVYSCGLIDGEPYNGAIRTLATAKVSMGWLTVFIKGIGANWCVCLAVWLALAGHTLLEKMAGCWLPVMAFVALGYEHSIANMFFIPGGMLAGADITVGRFVTANLIPATLGNIVGGAVFVGCVHTYLYLPRSRKDQC